MSSEKAGVGAKTNLGSFLIRRDSPVIMMPPSELREIIIETMPYMTFNQPKIIKTMSNNETMIRFARKSEEPDAFSFDVQLCPVKSLFPCDEYGGSFSYDYLWIFMNGAISVADISFKKEEPFSNDRIIYYDTFDVKLPRLSKHLSLIDGSVEEIRRKIIDKIATINS